MINERRKYIYLSNLNYDGTVFRTQIIDWLHLYSEKGLRFDIIQLFHIKDLKRFTVQKNKIREITKLKTTFFVYFPSRGVSILLNVIVLYWILLKYAFRFKEIIIFSRGLFGKEITILKKLFPRRVSFYFDARAASAEENKYAAIKQGDFSKKRYSIISHVYYTEYKTLIAAQKIFAVSRILQNYFEKNYKINADRFVSYPCLSDASKFYFSKELRSRTREELGLKSENKVFLYSGGAGSLWHITTTLFDFFSLICGQDQNAKFIFLTKDNIEISKMLETFPVLREKLISMSVENEQMVKYLNAADYGLLFRENYLVNNVASPTKFAEYILCGLPVIISEGVGDYSEFTRKFKVGTVVVESTLNNLHDFDTNTLYSLKYDREYIADTGLKNLSKESLIDSLILNFTGKY